MQGGDPRRAAHEQGVLAGSGAPWPLLSGAGSVLAPGEKGHWGEGLAESAENEPRDAAMGSALFFSSLPTLMPRA